MDTKKNQNTEGDDCEEKEQPSFCKFTDIYASDRYSIKTLVSLALEHNFHGIAVPQNDVEIAASTLGKYNHSDMRPPSIIAIADHPYGNHSLDVRSYMILASIEKGATEVEMVAPHRALLNNDWLMIENDVKVLTAVARERGINLTYVVDQLANVQKPGAVQSFCKIAKAYKLGGIVNAVSTKHMSSTTTDTVIWMRDVKKFTGIKTKVFMNAKNQGDVGVYAKAGVNFFAMPWDIAPAAIHEYEEVLRRSDSKSPTE